MSDMFNIDQVVHLRELEKARLKRSNRGLRREVQLLTRELQRGHSLTDDLLPCWQEIYQVTFQINPDFSKICLPRSHPGFDWLVPVVPEIPTNMVWQALKEQMKCFSYYGDDLEKAMLGNERTCYGDPYAVCVRSRPGSDDEFSRCSVASLKERHIPLITLDERLRLELFYWFENDSEHLDTESCTFCGGSTALDGSIPGVSWVDKTLYIGENHHKSLSPYARARMVVS